MTTNEHGESVRGFRVIIDNPRQVKWNSLPCSGFPLYTGEQALEVMQGYEKSRPKLAKFAETEAGGETEVLTMAEMESLYGKEFYDLAN